MARNGFKVLDSDIHVIEPPDLLATLYRPRVQGAGSQRTHGIRRMAKRRIVPGRSRWRAMGPRE